MISVRINGEIFDTNETIALTLSASEIGKIETKQGSTTNQFTLPYTSKLAAALGFPDQLNVTNTNPYRRIQGELLNENEVLSFGYFQINEISEMKVSLTFYGNNSDWFSQIKDFKLSEIDLSDIDHVYSEANIVNSWPNSWDDGYIYPIIDYGRSFSTINTEVTDWYPAVFLRYIILKGLEDKNLKMDGDLLEDDFFNKVIIPFSKKDFILDSELIQNEGTATSGLQIINNTTETKVNWTAEQDENGGWDISTNDRFDANADGIYGVRFTVVAPLAAWFTGNIVIRVKINGSQVEEVPLGAATFTFDRSYDLNNSDYIEWFAYHSFGSNIGMSFGATVSYTNQVYEGATITMKYTVPEIEFSDLLRWVGFTFGIIYTYDSYSKTVSFNKFSEIPSNTQLDWTEKLIKITKYDFNQAIERYPKTSRAQYDHTDDDILLLTYKNITGFNFGDGVITVNNEFNTKDEVIYTAPFAGTVTANTAGGYIPRIQRYSDLNANYLNPDVDPKPRVLVLHADDGLNWKPGSGIDVGSTTSEASCAYATFFKIDHSSSTIDSYTRSLAYATPQVNNPNDTAIFDTPYWEKYLRIFASPRIIECEMYLTESDISTLDFSRPIYLEPLASLFYLNKIKEYTGEGTTLVELVKFV